jgi:hypothetical protein
MILEGVLTGFHSRLHSRQKFGFPFAFAKGVFATAFRIMFAVPRFIAAFLNGAGVFIIHGLSFTSARGLSAADAPFVALGQDGTVSCIF